MVLLDLNFSPPAENGDELDQDAGDEMNQDAGDEMNQDAGDEIVMQEEENIGQNAGTKL
jgi:hypothetical protein